MMTFQRVQNDRLSDRVVTQLIQKIHAGELVSGSKLPSETLMAQQLGISRGILREALTILQSKGYISRLPKEGTLVCRVSDSDIGGSITAQVKIADYRDLLEFREAIECKAVQKVVELATDAQIDELLALVEQSREEGSTHRSIDYYFHYRLAQYSHNSLFVVFLDMYYDTINEMARRSYQDEKRQAEAKCEHLDIVSAIRNRNASEASSAMRTHLSHLRRHISDEVNA